MSIRARSDRSRLDMFAFRDPEGNAFSMTETA